MTDEQIRKISSFITCKVTPEYFRFKKRHGSFPTRLCLPMDLYTDVCRMTKVSQYRGNHNLGLELHWNGEEGSELWSVE